MSMISFVGLESLSFNRCEVKFTPRFRRSFATIRMTTEKSSEEKKKVKEISLQIPLTPLPAPHRESLFAIESIPQFDRLQPSDNELCNKKSYEFGSFVAREAVLDEEYWSAAWIRAESHWEDQSSYRYVDSLKRQFADQEFTEIKKRNGWKLGQKSACIVAVRKEVQNVKRTVLKSIVGTLDLSTRYLLPGETFPGERVSAPPFCRVNRTPENKYCYVSNVCVIRSARRQGIARNMLQFAVEVAISEGVQQVYIHVHTYNKAALELYRKMGFEIVEAASSRLLEEHMFLLGLMM